MGTVHKEVLLSEGSLVVALNVCRIVKSTRLMLFSATNMHQCRDTI